MRWNVTWGGVKRCLGEGLVLSYGMQPGRKEGGGRAHSVGHSAFPAQRSENTVSCPTYTQIPVILATEKKISLAEKKKKNNKNNTRKAKIFPEWFSKAHLQHIKKSSCIKSHFWLKLTWQFSQPRIDPLFVFRDLGSVGGSSVSEFPELLHKENIVLFGGHLRVWYTY